MFFSWFVITSIEFLFCYFKWAKFYVSRHHKIDGFHFIVQEIIVLEGRSCSCGNQGGIYRNFAGFEHSLDAQFYPNYCMK